MNSAENPRWKDYGTAQNEASPFPPHPDVQPPASVPSPVFQTPHLGPWAATVGRKHAESHNTYAWVLWLLHFCQLPIGWILQHMMGWVGPLLSISVYLTSQQLPQQTEPWIKLTQWRTCINKTLLSPCCFKVPMETTKHMIFDQLSKGLKAVTFWVSIISYMISCCSSSSITNEHGSYSKWRLPRESHVEGVSKVKLIVSAVMDYEIHTTSIYKKQWALLQFFLFGLLTNVTDEIAYNCDLGSYNTFNGNERWNYCLNPTNSFFFFWLNSRLVELLPGVNGGTDIKLKYSHLAITTVLIYVGKGRTFLF